MRVHEKMNIRTYYNALLFNLFRFQCFFQYWITWPMFVVSSAIGFQKILIQRHKTKDWRRYINDNLNNPRHGISLHFARGNMALLEGAVLVTVINFIAVGLTFDIAVWNYLLISSFLVSILVTFLFLPDHEDDFRDFASWSTYERRKYAGLTILLVLIITGGLIVSFVFVFRSIAKMNCVLPQVLR